MPGKVRVRLHGEDGDETAAAHREEPAGSSLLAQVIVSKIADHLPVHRQAKIFRRFGVEIADQTMWLDAAIGGTARSLCICLKQFVLSSKVVGTDDTPVKVLTGA